MDLSNDYKIKKNEKGPLQRFKNQNLILKKFGDLGLSVYKAITGKRSLTELKNDVSVDPKLFDQMIEFMEKNELIILEKPSSSKEELPVDSEPVSQEAPIELPKKKTSSKKKVVDELPPEPELPKEEIAPEPSYSESTSSFDDEIKPIDLDLPSTDSKKKKTVDEPEPLDFVETPKESEPIETPPQEPSTPEPDISPIENTSSSQSSSLGTLEQIIFDKYGDLGLKVYSLIDGQRTAEEIMRQTGLTESKLVEILDFLDEQGIIKLDYPRNNAPPSSAPLQQNAFSGGGSNYGAPSNYTNPQSSYAPSYSPPSSQQTSSSFSPMIEGETKNDENSPVPFPVEIYSKAPVDIVRAVQLKTKILLKYGDKGNKIMEMIDGKNDVLDICLKLSLPLYTVYELINFMMENGLLIRRASSRSEVKSKYGDEGYTIYKKYGREGLLFYELVGKEMGIKAMADMVSKDKNKILEMFIFIYQVLGVELPVDKNLLAKELN